MRFTSKPALKIYATLITKSIKNWQYLSTMNMDMDSGSDNNWRGVPLTELYGSQSPWGAPEFRLVSPSYNHAVLYHVPSSGCLAADRPPKPQIGQDKWDSEHVRMPCSDQSLYPVVDNNGVSHLKKRWEMIENALSKPIRNSHELGSAILSYNTNFRNTWKFKGLHKLFNEYLEEEETRYFFDVTLPEIIKLALDLPKLVQAPIPLLKQHKNFSVSLSQQQIASLLANAFFCTFPRRNATKKTSEYASYPFINFNSSGLYESTNSDANLEKLKCICHYFRRVVTKVPVGTLTFSRRSVPPRDCPAWAGSTRPIGSIPLHVEPVSTIEDADSLIQIDFANKFLGGGVLGHGCVQEEIRFVICPELMISMLFTEVMRPNEALMIIGAERYSKYVGYGHSFQFAGEHRDGTPRDSSARRRTAVLAIDAVPYSGLAQEFRREAITRELNKAWVGVSFDTDVSSDRLQYPGVATGNWGCGAFGGTPHLKSLIQLMACSQARRPMAYYTFGDTQLRDDIANMYNLLARHNVTVGQLYRYIVRFAQENNVLLTRFYTYLEKVLKENKESSQNSSDNMMDISITESTAGPVVIEDGSTDNSPDLFSQDEMDESLLEVTIQSERIANKTDTKKETPKITRKAETNTNKQVTPIQSTKHLTEQQIEQQITQQIDQEVAQLVEQKESSKSPPTADTKKMSLLDAVTIMDQDDKHEQHTSPASNKRFSLRTDTKPAMNTESESTPERKKGTPKKKITDYFSTRNK
ncbi:poly(ADP-ribose) glycohydrolase isoform X1 [Spodoptera frugiperda]|uniref:poly(ADP-ribose) glycohydrolase n=2 Tax=Spodoptera frugiperda TaxID=7108 RepID=A0A9R0E990_SPOFR|nr:poly(ADP-ribose) glycohydrolase isoform X1 [Spodoptera frugiperda]